VDDFLPKVVSSRGYRLEVFDANNTLCVLRSLNVRGGTAQQRNSEKREVSTAVERGRQLCYFELFEVGDLLGALMPG